MKPLTRKRLHWVIGHWRPYARFVPVLLLLTVLNGMVLVAIPRFMQFVIDGIHEGVSREIILKNVAWLFAVGLAHGVIYFSLMSIRMTVNLNLDYGIRMRAFSMILRQGRGFFNHFRTGDLVTRLTDDVSEKLAWFLCSGIFRGVEAVVVIVFCVFMMLRIDPVLTLWAGGPLPILVIVFSLIAGRLEARYQSVQESISRLNNHLESVFSGIRVIKGFAVEREETARFADSVEGQRRAELKAVRLQTVIDSMYGDIWQLGIVGVLLVGGLRVINGHLTLGELVAFDAYIFLLVFPMLDIGQLLVRGRISAVSIDRLREIEEHPVEVPDGSGPPAVLRPRDDLPPETAPAFVPEKKELRLTFEHIAYTYPGAQSPALENVGFSAEPGCITALVGPVGAGKSSLLSLVPALALPCQGRILVGGSPLMDWDLEHLRRQTGYVSQQPVLFSTSIRENIRMGRPWVTDQDVDMAIHTSGFSRDRGAFPQGLDTEVGPRGLRLSGGQKQRVALARALAGRPSLLILDDCTSALDADTEAFVWKELYRILPHCTTLLVTHRPATLHRAARVVVLDQGSVVQTGLARELEQTSGVFQKLYKRWVLGDGADGGLPNLQSEPQT